MASHNNPVREFSTANRSKRRKKGGLLRLRRRQEGERSETPSERNDDARGFEVLPKRWIVERTFGWFGWYRRLSKDYEELTDNSEAMIFVCMIHRMLRHLKPSDLAYGWET